MNTNMKNDPLVHLTDFYMSKGITGKEAVNKAMAQLR
jgi:hypothetical protein